MGLRQPAAQHTKALGVNSPRGSLIMEGGSRQINVLLTDDAEGHRAGSLEGPRRTDLQLPGVATSSITLAPR